MAGCGPSGLEETSGVVAINRRDLCPDVYGLCTVVQSARKSTDFPIGMVAAGEEMYSLSNCRLANLRMFQALRVMSPRLRTLFIMLLSSRCGVSSFFHNPQPYQLSLPAATAWQERFAKMLDAFKLKQAWSAGRQLIV